MNEVRIPYKPRILIMLLAILFFGMCTGILAYAAVSNDSGMLLNGIISFSKSEATLFYWVLSGLSALFVLGGIYGSFKAVTSRKELILTDTSISAPKSGFNNTIVTILYDDVDFLELQSVYKEIFLNIHAKDGRKLSISRSMLPAKSVFDQVVATVTKNTGAYAQAR